MIVLNYLLDKTRVLSAFKSLNYNQNYKLLYRTVSLVSFYLFLSIHKAFMVYFMAYVIVTKLQFGATGYSSCEPL